MYPLATGVHTFGCDFGCSNLYGTGVYGVRASVLRVFRVSAVWVWSDIRVKVPNLIIIYSSEY